ncbi:MAG: tetratricopeptide repeat protein [Clostridia bacterium]|nr:tetratricopeptide repeat protein [Clostridia bacterium]
MINVYKFVAKHRTLILYPLTVIECIVAMALIISVELTRREAIVVCALILIINSLAVNHSFSRIVKEILDQRKGGDPNYAIALSDEMLSVKHPPHIRAPLILNKCVFLRDMGRFDAALDILLGVDADELAPVHTFLLYNNVSDVYSAMGNMAKAEEYYLLAKEHFDAIPEGKLKDHYSILIPLSGADIHILKGEYRAAIECAQRVPEKKREFNYHSVMARALIGTGDTDGAREHYNKMLESGYSNIEIEEISRLL